MKIKKFIWILIFLLLVFVLIILVRTFTYKFGDTGTTVTAKAVQQPATSEKSIQRLVGGIQIPTVSTEVYENTNFEPFDTFKSYLRDVYPAVYSTMETDTVNTYGLVFRWKGKNSALNPILFLSHYDVVPPGDESEWQYPPFSGKIVDGVIHGRGTLDMKSMLFSIMESADALIAEGFQPERDIWIAFGHDEEVSGRQGALKIAPYFDKKGLRFDAVYDEGGFIMAPKTIIPSLDKPLALVGTGEKGFLTIYIKVKGKGGHSSAPPEKSSLVYAAEIIEKLNANQMPARLIPPIQSFLTNIGGEMNFISRVAIANRWLFKSQLLNSLEKSPSSNALVRTTTAITMEEGSAADNVLSPTAMITANFRILQGDSVDGVMAHVKQLCEGYDVEIEIESAREPSSVSPENTRGFEIIGEKLGQLYPDAIVTSYITIGGTDAYKYQIVSDNIYRLIPVFLTAEDQGTIHNYNEKISVENYGKMLWYFKEVMKSY